MHSIKDSVSKFRSFLSWFGVFIVFDLLFSYMRSSFELIRARFVYCCCLFSVSYNCYLLGWENMCEIIAIQRRILELIRGSSSLVGQVFLLLAGALWGSVKFLYSSLSTTSSYIDDIAHIKIRWSETYGWFPQPRGRSACVSLLFYGVIDYLLRLTGIFYLMGSAM